MTNEQAYKILTEHTRHYIPSYDEEALEVAIEAVEKQMRAADVVEVRHGKWIKTSYPEVHRCSICNKPSNTSKGLDKYCPNCGAKMDGEAK